MDELLRARHVCTRARALRGQRRDRRGPGRRDRDLDRFGRPVVRDPSPSRRIAGGRMRSLRSRRLAFVVVLVVLVGAALASGRAATGPATPPLTAKVAPSAAVLAESATVWFCPGLPVRLPPPSPPPPLPPP